MSKEWNEELRKKMKGFSHQAPVDVWDNVEKIIFEDKKKAVILPLIPQKPWFKQPVVLYRGGLLIGAATVALMLFVKPSVNEHITKPIKEKVSSKVNAVATAIERQDAEVVEQRTIAPKQALIAKVEREKQSTLFNHNYLNEHTERHQIAGERAVAFTEVAVTFAGDTNTEPISLEELIEKEKAFWEQEELIATSNNKLKSKRKGWDAAVHTNGIFAKSQQTIPGYATMNGTTLGIDSEIVQSINGGTNAFSDIFKANRIEDVVTNVTHKAPITAGVSIGYGLSDRWSVSTGLTYTIMSSELESGQKYNRMVSKQTLHFLGVPLQVNYRMFNLSKVNTYVTAGTLFEKTISGNTKTDYIVNDQLSKQVDSRTNIKEVQLSLNAGVGMEYRVSDLIGIYVEPGVQYHVKDNSEIGVFYKEKPFNFNLKAGLRFNLSK
ncbi:outer membrane beta-barrel protein [Myroides pelagicus]|uniref:Outer membrane beta-barrel protein n=1 Tax=Myroides pelagicus TaxID=270914 RepID=A0A7K1GGV4_9FLAO|nr:outer membrane beta-barrel protein [Myroides pelagicus]MTH28312.1 outer membrane beta-barrel protein [Myroides pelagicus]